MKLRTVVIRIDNSESPIRWGEWANFCQALDYTISYSVWRIVFKGGSDWDGPKQQACWICEVTDVQAYDIAKDLAEVAEGYNFTGLFVSFIEQCGEDND